MTISFTELYSARCGEALCDGDGWLTEEMMEAPATCALCNKQMCDWCAAGVKIPYDVLGEEPWTWEEHRKHCQGHVSQFGESFPRLCPHSSPTEGQEYDCFVCLDCFNEEWVK